ncbi:hypothetical protein ACFVFS_35015 [Kitasatospora sp. NPDC057692]|uniref:hypothetical protein n=1 Tax=Kitasatospora sp. NPDC057692 TaxID=3346215 RepID=UPI0036C0C51D
MRRSVRLDRRIQAGAAHVSLAVRGGEPSWSEFGSRLGEFAAARFLVVTDGTAPPGPLARVRALAAGRAPTTVHDLRDGPLPDPGPTAGTVVVAVGGEHACGIPADVRVPTDLAAACGPAQAVHHPVTAALAWVRADLLAARPAGRTRAGMVAVVRHVLAVCPAQYPMLAALLRPEARYDAPTLAALLALCADARSALVCFDPGETGPALALGYGRSLAEAVRAVAGPALAPGDAGALGLLLAARAAARLGLAAGATGWAHRELLARNGSATVLPAGVDTDRLTAALVAATRPGLLLLAELGRPYCAGGRLLTPVDGAVLGAAVAGLADRPGAGVPRSRTAGAEPVGAEPVGPEPAVCEPAVCEPVGARPVPAPGPGPGGARDRAGSGSGAGRE